MPPSISTQFPDLKLAFGLDPHLFIASLLTCFVFKYLIKDSEVTKWEITIWLKHSHMSLSPVTLTSFTWIKSYTPLYVHMNKAKYHTNVFVAIFDNYIIRVSTIILININRSRKIASFKSFEANGNKASTDVEGLLMWEFMLVEEGTKPLVDTF